MIQRLILTEQGRVLWLPKLLISFTFLLIVVLLFFQILFSFDRMFKNNQTSTKVRHVFVSAHHHHCSLKYQTTMMVLDIKDFFFLFLFFILFISWFSWFKRPRNQFSGSLFSVIQRVLLFHWKKWKTHEEEEWKTKEQKCLRISVGKIPFLYLLSLLLQWFISLEKGFNLKVFDSSFCSLNGDLMMKKSWWSRIWIYLAKEKKTETSGAKSNESSV